MIDDNEYEALKRIVESMKEDAEAYKKAVDKYCEKTEEDGLHIVECIVDSNHNFKIWINPREGKNNGS